MRDLAADVEVLDELLVAGLVLAPQVIEESTAPVDHADQPVTRAEILLMVLQVLRQCLWLMSLTGPCSALLFLVLLCRELYCHRPRAVKGNPEPPSAGRSAAGVSRRARAKHAPGDPQRVGRVRGGPHARHATPAERGWFPNLNLV